MSKICVLIKELCSKGIEYKNIKELCLENFWVMPSTPIYQNEGIPYITSKNIRNGVVMFDDVKYITEDDYKSISNNRPITENDFLISMIGTIGEVGIVRKEDLPFYGQNMYLLRLNTNLINIKYFYHYFTSDMVRKKLLGEKNNGNQGYLKTKNIESLKVPVPPLEIQKEIVRILDKFGELEANLEAELESRKSQYEFWRDKIFKNTNNLITIGETCDVITGGEPPEDTIKGLEADDEHPYPVYGNGKEIYGYSSSYRVDKDSTVISSIGANTGAIYYRKAYFTPIIRLKVVIPKSDELLPRYLYYALQTSKFKSKNGSVPNLNASDIKSIKFPLVPIEKQQYIVNVLDKFDTLVNDMSIGLPAEIELRRKQYEYYRNKLLSFEELSVNE